MTTLVYRNDIIAADSQMTLASDDEDIQPSSKTEMQKLYLFDNSIVGICGEVFAAKAFLDLYKKSLRGKRLKITDTWAIMMTDSFEALVIKEHEMLVYNYLLSPIDISNKSYYALGSGSDVAYGALFMGATAIEAVKAASDRNAATGFQVVSYSRADIPLIKRREKAKLNAAKKKHK